MTKFDQYRAYAAECRHLADTARDQVEKERWLKLADSWLLLLYAPKAVAADQSVVLLHEPGRGMSDDLPEGRDLSVHNGGSSSSEQA